jgi:hypothetical protein
MADEKEVITKELQRHKIDRHGRSQFRADGNKLTTVRFGASFFGGDVPEKISISAEGIATTLTRAERKEAAAAVPKEVARAARKAAKEARDAVIKAALDKAKAEAGAVTA